MKKYYHMFANGDDAKDFITSEQDFKNAFNRFGVCASMTQVVVLSFSVEDSHPHALLYGTYEECLKYARMYEDISIRSIVQKRGSRDGVNLHLELYEIQDEQYLRNVAAYTIVQATKDGKAIMPYDYMYGTGALYFRSIKTIMPWLIDNYGTVRTPVSFGSLTLREKRTLLATKIEIPSDWLVCNGFVLPTNYVDIKGYESIFKTHNCFRAFLSSGKNKDNDILNKMAEVRGVMIEDLEARRIYREAASSLLNVSSTRSLSTNQRIIVARHLRKTYHLSYRQLSMLTKIPETEIRKYC